MTRNMAIPVSSRNRTAARHRAISLIELLVVLAVIGLLLALLLPAIHYSRQSARNVACMGNLHQLGSAMTHYVETRKKLPDPPMDGKISGWAIAILPYMEESLLADSLAGNPAIDSPAHRELARKRPEIMICPSRPADPDEAAIPLSHYKATFKRRGLPKFGWTISDQFLSVEVPWPASPEADLLGRRGPHGGLNYITGSGGRAHGVSFFSQGQ